MKPYSKYEMDILTNKTITATEFSPEFWEMDKSAIYNARTAIEVGIENTEELLLDHEVNYGRTTRGNRMTAERLEAEIRQMKSARLGLKKPD